MKAQPTSVIATEWAMIIAIVAFSAGAGLSWLILHEQHARTAQPPTYLTQAPSGPIGGISDPLPPDVSQMSPSESAVTLGNWNYDRKAWQKAIEDYQRAISLGMDNADVRTDLGNALRFSGEPQKALEQYQAARRQNPRHENSLCNMATLYSQVLKDPGNAVVAWKEYLRLFPSGEKASAAKEFLAAESLKEP